MSADKLNQSLDDILKTRRQSVRRGRGARRANPGRPAATAAPVGGVSKTTKQAKQSKQTPTGPAATSGSGESKIMISNLPQDVEESQLKEYFTQAVQVSKPKRIVLQYGPQGRSLGIATVIFHKSDHASKAVKALDNVRIDNRLIKVEVLVSAKDAPAAAPKASLAERVSYALPDGQLRKSHKANKNISQPKKDKPKPATATKATTASGARGRGERGRGRGRGGRNPREKKKTVEELDAEMADYFPAGDGGNDAMVTNGGTAGQTAAADTAMDDEML